MNLTQNWGKLMSATRLVTEAVGGNRLYMNQRTNHAKVDGWHARLQNA